MPTNYFWDLGLDWDMGLDFDERTFLQTGFYNLDTRRIDTPVQLGNGKQLGFNIYDTTPSGAKTASITKVEVEFKKLYPTQPHNSPGSGSNPMTLRAPVGGSRQYSTPFKGNFPVWPCTPNVTLTNNGRYLMKISVTAKATDKTEKTWVVDPEMLIGESG